MSEEDDEESKRQICADCGITSAPIHTNYTLIGSHGWRLTRTLREGHMVPEWRCPKCFVTFKSQRPESKRRAP